MDYLGCVLCFRMLEFLRRINANTAHLRLVAVLEAETKVLLFHQVQVCAHLINQVLSILLAL